MSPAKGGAKRRCSPENVERTPQVCPCPVENHLFQRTDNPVILKKAHALRENFGIGHSGRGTDKTEVEKKAVCRYPEQINSITSR